MTTTIRCDIVSAEEEIFHGTAQMVVATGELGELGIAPRHAPLITRLKPGQVRVILENDGHAVTTANGGEDGITAFRAALRAGRPVAAVITDLGMPNIDGRKVAAAIKADSPETPIILLTGWGQRLIDDDEAPAHVDRVLSKPPKLRDLRQALLEVTAGKT